MKKIGSFDKKILVILYILFAIYYLFCWYESRYIYGGKENQEMYSRLYNICNTYFDKNEEERESIIQSNYDISIDDETCEEVNLYKAPANSAYNIFATFFEDETIIFPFFIPVIILLPFIFGLSKEFKNKYIKNYCLRDNYKKYVYHIFKTSYKNIFIIPIFVIMTFIISYFLSNQNLDYSTDLALNRVLPNTLYLNTQGFPMVYILTLFLGIGLYINIGLIILSKNKNFIVAILESSLTIFLIWCFTSIAVGRYAKMLFSISPNNFNILGIYTWYGVDNIYIFVIFNILLYLVSLIVAILSYKNKERIINMCEK